MRAFRFAIRTCGHAALGGWRWTAACRGRAPNSFLLMDALCRCLDATDEIAAMAVVVDAKKGRRPLLSSFRIHRTSAASALVPADEDGRFAVWRETALTPRGPRA